MENEKALAGVSHKFDKLELHDIDEDEDKEEEEQEERPVEELKTFLEDELNGFDVEGLKAQIALLEGGPAPPVEAFMFLSEGCYTQNASSKRSRISPSLQSTVAGRKSF